MNIRLHVWKVGALALLVVTGLTACVVGGGYGGYDGDVNYGVGFYEPYGYEYGGWGGGYRVGPPRGGHFGGERGPVGGRHAPSIPSGPRGGGHGGGGHR